MNRFIKTLSVFLLVATVSFVSAQQKEVDDAKKGGAKALSKDDIKKAYRKMAKQYHPDKVAHLGEDFASFAENKFKSINDAYQKIKKERSL